ncbi:hypothetical protein [Streptomyces sp. NPDC056660]|uniref:hypothetical protein n=1 Tax=Streptomyces sp. NPDC056660 TaxID=3345897 RepID=UPI0036D16971
MTTIGLTPGDQLVLSTDGLVETRHHASEETHDRLLESLRDPDDHDDVALLIARARPRPLRSSATPRTKDAPNVDVGAGGHLSATLRSFLLALIDTSRSRSHASSG